LITKKDRREEALECGFLVPSLSREREKERTAYGALAAAAGCGHALPNVLLSLSRERSKKAPVLAYMPHTLPLAHTGHIPQGGSCGADLQLYIENLTHVRPLHHPAGT
jgi:hypothetical protein